MLEQTIGIPLVPSESSLPSPLLTNAVSNRPLMCCFCLLVRAGFACTESAVLLIPVTGLIFKYLTTFQTGRQRKGKWMSQRLRSSYAALSSGLLRREMYRRSTVLNNGACHFSVILLRGTKCAARLDRDIVRLVSRPGGVHSRWFWADEFPLDVLDSLHLTYCSCR